MKLTVVWGYHFCYLFAAFFLPFFCLFSAFFLPFFCLFSAFFLPFFCLFPAFFLPVCVPPVMVVCLFFAFGFAFYLSDYLFSAFSFCLFAAFTFSIYLLFTFILPFR